jgi:segregation and condensation protein B
VLSHLSRGAAEFSHLTAASPKLSSLKTTIPFTDQLPAGYVAGMRRTSAIAAIQLQSRAARYQHRLARESVHPGKVYKSPWAGRNAPIQSPASQTPTARTPELAKLEAILFLTREPLSSRKLAKLANLEDGTKARSLVRRLAVLHTLSGSAFCVEEVAGGFQLLTHRKFSNWLRKLEHVPGETRLSGPALETLGVVAYRQPVLRAEIESIRGVQCGEILRQLMERDLVRIVGRAEELGRPFQYGTTRRFLQLFGLRHIDDLPRAEEFRRVGIPASPAVANQPEAGNDIRFNKLNSDQEDLNVTVADLVQDDELLKKLHAAQVLAAYNDEDFEDEDEDEDDEDDDLDDDDEDEDYDYDDDEDDDYDDEEEEEVEEELEGDWEEVEDDDEEEEEDEDEDDDDLDDDDDDEEEDWEEDDE